MCPLPSVLNGGPWAGWEVAHPEKGCRALMTVRASREVGVGVRMCVHQHESLVHCSLALGAVPDALQRLALTLTAPRR